MDAPSLPLEVPALLGPLPLLHALALFDGLAGAASALHAAGLVHRDIKPENIDP